MCGKMQQQRPRERALTLQKPLATVAIPQVLANTRSDRCMLMSSSWTLDPGWKPALPTRFALKTNPRQPLQRTPRPLHPSDHTPRITTSPQVLVVVRSRRAPHAQRHPNRMRTACRHALRTRGGA